MLNAAALPLPNAPIPSLSMYPRSSHTPGSRCRSTCRIVTVCAYCVAARNGRKGGIKGRVECEREAASKWVRPAVSRSHRSHLNLHLLTLLLGAFCRKRGARILCDERARAGPPFLRGCVAIRLRVVQAVFAGQVPETLPRRRPRGGQRLRLAAEVKLFALCKPQAGRLKCKAEARRTITRASPTRSVRLGCRRKAKSSKQQRNKMESQRSVTGENGAACVAARGTSEPSP